MIIAEEVEKLLGHLQRLKPKQFNVALLPDFFLDRFAFWNGSIEQFSTILKQVVTRKGGSIDNVMQIDSRGGNAVNTAAALAALGVHVFPLICTNKLGMNLLRFYFQQPNIDFSHIKMTDHMSTTTALEFSHKGEKRNVMLRDLGSLKNFGPQDLTEKDWSLLKDCDYVYISNWAGTRKYGTDLAQRVFEYVKSKGRGKTYYDTADPLTNRSKIPALIKKVLLHQSLIDVLSLNENEATAYAKFIDPKKTAELQKQHRSIAAQAKDCAKILAKRLTSRIDLHATSYSASFIETSRTMVSAFKVKAFRATGAGDAWNAGNIYGDLNNLSAEMRLTLANAIAAFYISSPTGEHPGLYQLRKFLAETPKI
ncbi:MAG: carbohydrate kinase family protein [Candidatus Bathyarchaeota archaeon]|nr:MAG: carbohydrate kinase family protein [Candidatus Bathyarchaeota archaeon]